MEKFAKALRVVRGNSQMRRNWGVSIRATVRIEVYNEDGQIDGYLMYDPTTGLVYNDDTHVEAGLKTLGVRLALEQCLDGASNN